MKGTIQGLLKSERHRGTSGNFVKNKTILWVDWPCFLDPESWLKNSSKMKVGQTFQTQPKSLVDVPLELCLNVFWGDFLARGVCFL